MVNPSPIATYLKKYLFPSSLEYQVFPTRLIVFVKTNAKTAESREIFPDSTSPDIAIIGASIPVRPDIAVIKRIKASLTLSSWSDCIIIVIDKINVTNFIAGPTENGSYSKSLSISSLLILSCEEMNFIPITTLEINIATSIGKTSLNNWKFEIRNKKPAKI